jgi:hypothetical protein
MLEKVSIPFLNWSKLVRNGQINVRENVDVMLRNSRMNATFFQAPLGNPSLIATL